MNITPTTMTLGLTTVLGGLSAAGYLTKPSGFGRNTPPSPGSFAFRVLVAGALVTTLAQVTGYLADVAMAGPPSDLWPTYRAVVSAIVTVAAVLAACWYAFGTAAAIGIRSSRRTAS